MDDDDLPPLPDHREELTLELDGTYTIDIHRPGLHCRFTQVDVQAFAETIDGFAADLRKVWDDARAAQGAQQ